MQNYHALETEVAHRRREWEWTVATVTQDAQPQLQHGGMGWSHLPQLVLASIRTLAAPRLSITSTWNTSTPRTWLPRPVKGVVPM